MRLLELDFRAVGPFTNVNVDLSEGTEGLHIVYGANEAGKSSALRALRALLFGFEPRTTDNFLHNYPDLRVAGKLKRASGDVLEFTRKKGVKETVRTFADDAPLADNVLAPFLGTVTAKQFSLLFGIDHMTLREGGQAILEGEGDLDQALFSAASGTNTVRSALKSLEKEFRDIFVKTGRIPTLNVAIGAFKEQEKAVRDATLSPNMWNEKRRELGNADARYVELKDKLATLRPEQIRLQRLERALGPAAELRSAEKTLRDLGDVALLPDDFGERFSTIRGKRETRGESLRELDSDIADLESQLESLAFNRSVLERATAIEELYKQLGAVLEGASDIPRLEAERATGMAAAGQLLNGLFSEVPLDLAEDVRPTRGARRRIRDLATTYHKLAEKEQQVGERIKELESGRAAAELRLKKTPEPADTAALASALAAASDAGDLDRELSEAREGLESETEAARIETARLRLSHLSLGDVEVLPVPSEAAVSQYRKRAEELADEERKHSLSRERLREEIERAKTGIEKHRLAGQVPLEEELDEARDKRDFGWELLKKRWIDGEDVAEDAHVYSPDRELHETYEAAVSDADTVGDRLRREANRVETLAALKAELAGLDSRREESDRQAGILARKRSEFDADWRKLWQGAVDGPDSPPEMSAWLQGFDVLHERLERIRRQRRQTESLDVELRRHRSAIRKTLQGLGSPITSEELKTHMRSAESVLKENGEALDERRQGIDQRDRIEEELGLARNARDAVSGERDQWAAEWREATTSLRLAEEMVPADAEDVLDEIDRLFKHIELAEDRRGRIQGIEERASDFAARVRETAEGIGVEGTPERVAEQLHVLLKDQREKEARHREIAESLDKRRRERSRTKEKLEGLDARIAELCGIAGCDEKGVPEAEAASQKRRDTEKRIERLQRELVRTAEGVPVEELILQVDQLEPGDLRTRIDQLSAEIKELGEQRETALKERTRAEDQFRHLDGSDRAAAAESRARTLLADIRDQAEQYMRLRAAHHLIKLEMERYRRDNEAPTVLRAGEIFTHLTLKSFVRLESDTGEKDEPVLLGVRADGSRVTVEGMSSGTRDQLYLALRLATLENLFESTEAMPFIVDDALVNFDDDRSMAALEQLGALSEKTQVIVFTHHRRVVDQAAELAPGIAYVRSL